MKILELFKYIFENLEKHKFDYLLSGSYALNLYTTPRSTRDIDIVVDVNETRIDNFLEIFSHEFYYNRAAILKEIQRKRMFNIIYEPEAFKLDFIIKKNDELSDEQFRRKKYIKINGFKAWAITPEDLILAKLQWIQQTGTPFQMRDINELLEIGNLDKNYIMEWCKKLNLNTFNLINERHS
jgi:hypothetical protein